MQLYLVTILSALTAVGAFTPTHLSQRSPTVLSAEANLSRKAFFSAAAITLSGVVPLVPAFAMDQELVTSPTEQWETGKPTAAAEKDRIARYANARTQMTSNFPPIKRLTLERKSPVVSCVEKTAIPMQMDQQLKFDFIFLHWFPLTFPNHKIDLTVKTRLDINAPDFTAYKKTYPGLFRE